MPTPRLEKDFDSYQEYILYDEGYGVGYANGMLATNQELKKRDEEVKKLQRCLGFFANVIKSGEPWTETCERYYQEALNQ